MSSENAWQAIEPFLVREIWVKWSRKRGTEKKRSRRKRWKFKNGGICLEASSKCRRKDSGKRFEGITRKERLPISRGCFLKVSATITLLFSVMSSSLFFHVSFLLPSFFFFHFLFSPHVISTFIANRSLNYAPYVVRTLNHFFFSRRKQSSRGSSNRRTI